MNSLRFFNPYDEIRFTENLLPHWQQKGATYFITFRLADSIPAHLRDQLEHERGLWLQLHPEPWDAETEQEYHRRFSGAIERWIDAGYGACTLREVECAKLVDSAMRYFDGQRLALISSVVMPNHVHALLVQNPAHPLEDLLHSWKSFSSRTINRLVGARELYGNEAISIGLCGTRNIFGIVFDISAEIRRKHDSGLANTFYTRAM